MLYNPSIPLELISMSSDHDFIWLLFSCGSYGFIQFAVSSKIVGKIVGNDVFSKFLVLKYERSTAITFVIVVTKMVDIKNVLHFTFLVISF